jgi:hypothetical protein
MKILYLKLENFQGIKDALFEFDGNSASLYGDNATGKTTVFNALTWLLFDKASTGAKNFTPKTRGPSGEVHYLDHASEAQFSADDGRTVTLRKVLHEVYKKKRGSATDEFDGHSVDFFIDGVPTKEKEYTAALTAFCGGAEKMKMLTMPNYFSEDMPWDARRKILLEICGDVTDDDVINSSTDLAELPAYLIMPGTACQRYSVDEYKKIAAAKKTDINKQLLGIPGRIDEAQRAIPAEKVNVSTIDERLALLEKDYEALSGQKAAALTGNAAVAEARKLTADAVGALAEARVAYYTKAAADSEGANSEIDSIQRRIFTARGLRDAAQSEVCRYRRDIDEMNTIRGELLKQYNALLEERWDEKQSVCPTCHRALPEEDVARMREDFNVQKSNRLTAINERGLKVASKDSIKAAEQTMTGKQEEADKLDVEIQTLQQQLDALKAQAKTAPPFETTPEYTALAARIGECRAIEGDAVLSASEVTASVNAKMTTLQSEIRELQQRKGQAAQAEIQLKRIEELKAQEKDLAAQYEDVERGIYLCDLFTKAKVSMLTEQINGKFKNVRFRLFQEQINGGLKDDCEVMIPTDTGRMVPYTFANNAARINAGLEIIDALSRCWGITMPVFIDNAESVTRLIHSDTQVIRLVVSEPDKALRMELDYNRGECAA